MALFCTACSSVFAQTISGSGAAATWDVQTGTVSGATGSDLPATGTVSLAGTGGVVTVTNTGTGSVPTALTFAAAGYTLVPGATYLPLTVNTITVGSGVATLDLSLAPPGVLTVKGGGTLVFAANQPYLGATAVEAGTLRLGDGGTTGALGGDVKLGSVGVLTGAATGTLVFNRSNDLVFGGVISSGLGSGALVKEGSGVLTLTGVSTFRGATTVATGTLRLGGSTGALPAATTLSVASGATFDVNGRSATIGTLQGAGTVVLGAGDLQVTAGLFSGATGGTGTVTIDPPSKGLGTGALVVTGILAHTGGTRVREGTLQIGDGGAAGTLTGDVALGSITLAPLASYTGTLVFNRADHVTFGGNISGQMGRVVQDGSGALTLTGTHTFSGGFAVNRGTLRVTADSALPSGSTVAIAAGATFDYANSGGASLAGGVVSGAGNFLKSGAGLLTLTGPLRHTGTTTVNAGTLRLGASEALGAAGAVAMNGGTLDLAGYNQTVTRLSGNGVLALGGGTLTLNTSANYVGRISGGGGIIALAGQTFANNTFAFTTYTAAGGSTVVSGDDDGVNSASFWNAATTVGSGADFRARFDTTVNGAVTVENGGTLGGFPQNGYGAVAVEGGGRLSLEDGGIGTLRLATLSLAPGARLRLGLVDAAAGLGNSVSVLDLSGTLALGGTSAVPILVELVTAPNVLATFNFDPRTAYLWQFTAGAGDITGFNAAGFQIDTSGFVNAFNGQFGVILHNGELALAYNPTPVPEPAAFALLAGLGALLFGLRRRRRVA